MFKPDKLNDCINEMFAGEKTDSTSDSGSSDIGYNKTERFKRISYAFSDMDKMDEVDTMKRNLKLHMDKQIEHETQRVKRAFDNAKKDKKDLKRKNATLMGEKDQLEREIATLDAEQRNANDKLCAFEKKIAELLESRRKDTEIFDQEKRDLEQKNVECANQLCIEKRKFDREKKTLTEDYEALKKVQVEEKKTLEERNKALTQQLNAALQQNAAFAMDISNQKKKHDDKKRALEESFELFKSNWLVAMQQWMKFIFPQKAFMSTRTELRMQRNPIQNSNQKNSKLANKIFYVKQHIEKKMKYATFRLKTSNNMYQFQFIWMKNKK